MSMGSRRAERGREAVLNGDRESDSFVNSAVKSFNLELFHSFKHINKTAPSVNTLDILSLSVNCVDL